MLKKGLGKGLDMLFESAPQEDEAAAESSVSPQDVSETQLTLIEPNRNQPRRSFDPEKIDELAQSIREHGLIQPIIITPAQNGRYTIVAGERRWRAAKKAGLKTVPTVIREYSPEETAQIALIENLQREDLNPIEEAAGYRRLMDEFSLTQEAVSEKIGKSRSAVANSLRLLSLDDELQKLVSDGKISGGHARALLAVDDNDARRELADKIISGGLNVRQAETLAKKLSKPKRTKPQQPPNDAYTAELERIGDRISSELGTKVSISETKKRGRIEIEYYGADDLERILSALGINL